MNKTENPLLQTEFADLKNHVTSNDPVTIVVSDHEEKLPQQRKILSGLGHFLHDDMKVPFGQIIVLIAHDGVIRTSDEERSMIAGDYLSRYCHVMDHNSEKPYMSIGRTKTGAEIGVDPLVVGRKVIDVADALNQVVDRANSHEARQLVSPVVSFSL